MMVEKDADNHWHCTYHRKLQLLPNITKRQDRQGEQWIEKNGYINRCKSNSSIDIKLAFRIAAMHRIKVILTKNTQ